MHVNVIPKYALNAPSWLLYSKYFAKVFTHMRIDTGMKHTHMTCDLHVSSNRQQIVICFVVKSVQVKVRNKNR